MDISEVIDQCFTGWFEVIEFGVRVYEKGEGAGSLHSDHPFSVERRQEFRWQQPLVVQLAGARWHKPVKGAVNGGSDRVEPPLPGNLEEPDALMQALSGARTAYERSVGDAGQRQAEAALRRAHTAARVYLGYEQPWKGLARPCGDCGAQLIGRLDPPEVQCSGCDLRHVGDDWLKMI